MKFILILFALLGAFAQEKHNQTRTKDIDIGQSVHANNVKALVANNGWLFWGGGASGFISPSPVFSENTGQFATVFSSGLFFVGKIDGELRAAVGHYATDFIPGDWDEYKSDQTTFGSDNPKYKVYFFYSDSHVDYLESLLEKDDPTDDKRIHDFANSELEKVQTSLLEWDEAIAQGAPEIPPGDVAAYTIYHDADTDHRDDNGLNNSKTPMNLQIRQLVYSFRADNAVNNAVFAKVEFINKNELPINDLYVSMWADPDVGQYQDDLNGSDLETKLAYSYNGQPNDAQYSDVLNLGPPAVGYHISQGAIVDSIGMIIYRVGGETGSYVNQLPIGFIGDYETISNKYVTEATGFLSYNNGEEADNAEEYLNFMTNRFRTGDFNSPQVNALNAGLADSVTVNWMFHGDPVKRIGWFDTNPDNRKLTLNMDPIQLGISNGYEDISDPGYNSITFVTFNSFGGDYLGSVSKLKFDFKQIKGFFDSGHNLETINSPPAIVSTSAAFDGITIVWKPDIKDINGSTLSTEQRSDVGYRFEGYQLVQYTDAAKDDFIHIDYYDINNGTTRIYNEEYQENSGIVIPVKIISGSDSGIEYHVTLTKDYRNDKSLYLNNFYSYGLRAYYYNPNPNDASTYVKYGDWSEGLDSIMPTIYFNNLSIIFDKKEQLLTSISDESDGYAIVNINDRIHNEDISYYINFHTLTEDHIFTTPTLDTMKMGDVVWYLSDGTNRISDYQPQSIEGDVTHEAFLEGLRISVFDSPPSFKDLRVIANADGTLDPNNYIGAAADYNHWPGLGRTNIGQQQVNGSMWFISVNSLKQNNASYPEQFKTLNESGKMNTLVGSGLELRFTDNGKAYTYWDGKTVIDVPFEIWNIGTENGTQDDVRLIPYVQDENNNGVWDYVNRDSPMSGSTNDPELESIHWMMPINQAPGSVGYNQHIADLQTNSLNEYDISGSQTLMSYQTFTYWNGGDVTDTIFPNNILIPHPEIGTVFQLEMSTSNDENTSFHIYQGFVIDRIPFKAKDYLKNMTVFPNPFYGSNAQAAYLGDDFVTFANLPKIEDNSSVNIKIYTLNGELVRKLKYTGQSTYLRWFLDNDSGTKVKSNLFISVIEYKGSKTIKKLVVFRQDNY